MLIERYPTPQKRPSKEEEPRRVCPACEQLQCLCRPRFFAGQLLTEDDLNRLDHYIREKHRLHNRHLHGWGVVSGLEVTCHECEDTLEVSSGYALSPCGDDIVVCEDDTVDVCALIQECQKQKRRCEPPRRQREDCEDAEETWVLALCYDEEPTRGITALRSVGGSRVSGAGSSSEGSCGCHDNTNGHSNGASHSSAQAPLEQCEPTIICEGHRYRVYRTSMKQEDEEEGALIEKVTQCAQPFVDFAREVGSTGSDLDDASTDERNQLCCLMKRRLREILLSRPLYDCTLVDRLDRIRCTSAENNPMQQIISIWLQGLFSCLCSALMPPGPDRPDDNCVPLATVTVRKRDCHLLRVCNWTTHRKFATTVPALKYWLSPLPYGRQLRQFLDRFCCNLSDIIGDIATPGQADGEEGETGPTEAQPQSTVFTSFSTMPFTTMRRSRDFSNLLFEALSGEATTPDPETLFRGLMGATREDNTPFLKEKERGNLPQYLLLNQLARPLMQGAVPEALAGISGVRAKPMEEAEEETLQSQLEDLQRQVQAQQDTIDTLKDQLDENE